MLNVQVTAGKELSDEFKEMKMTGVSVHEWPFLTHCGWMWAIPQHTELALPTPSANSVTQPHMRDETRNTDSPSLMENS